jgi:gamma-glutamylcyclotransferase (GGCT)/AIG2-like uncharacterized protein YtfP
MMDCLVAVYGTLRAGQANAHYLAGMPCVGRCQLTGWRLVAGPEYPYAMRHADGRGGQIMLEVYRVTAACLAALDQLEDYPIEYDRSQMDTPFGLAWLYHLHPAQAAMAMDLPEVAQGDWVAYRHSDTLKLHRQEP